MNIPNVDDLVSDKVIASDQAEPWLTLAFNFTFATLPEPGLNFCTGTEILFYALSID